MTLKQSVHVQLPFIVQAAGEACPTESRAFGFEHLRDVRAGNNLSLSHFFLGAQDAQAWRARAQITSDTRILIG